ncbi:hypothetical protein LAT59_03730 [Candidatus Gracilibacteria bacterium]|nr:hypothetical protein [Candidatus Gracilibacteria bacterium]
MLESDIRIIEGSVETHTKAQKVSLDSGGELFYLYSTSDGTFSDLFHNKLLDTFLDKITTKNTYKDFSRGLESLNAFLTGWSQDDSLSLHALIGLFDGKSFYFSTVGNASALLGNVRGNIVEISDKDDTPKNFHFISSGDIGQGETLILSNIRLLDVLSKDDIEDGLGTKYIQSSGENIEHIVHLEKIEKSVACISLRVGMISQESKDSYILQYASYFFYKTFDNSVTKKILGYLYHVRDGILKKQKHTVQIIFGLGMILSIFVLYLFISSLFSLASKTQDVSSLQDTLFEAREFLDSASQNINNIDAYEMYMSETEVRVEELEAKNVFAEDVDMLRRDMIILEGQVNGVQAFDPSGELLYHVFSEEREVIKLLRTDSGRIYAVHDRSISGPIVRGETAENFVYNALSSSDSFIDATNVGNEIIIQTQEGKVVSFGTNNRFNVVNVTGQDTWFRSSLIRSFNQNIYTLSENRRQLYMHRRSGTNYLEGTPYLNEDDVATLGGIRSLGIDGGIYILQDDGMFLKLFRSPSYRIESLTLNRLPRNYIPLVTDPDLKVDMSASASYRHVYVLVGNRVFVFEPNSNRPADTKSLRFMGQIESRSSDIEAFHVVSDGDVFFADRRGIYRVRFDIEDFGVVIR